MYCRETSIGTEKALVVTKREGFFAEVQSPGVLETRARLLKYFIE